MVQEGDDHQWSCSLNGGDVGAKMEDQGLASSLLGSALVSGAPLRP